MRGKKKNHEHCSINIMDCNFSFVYVIGVETWEMFCVSVLLDNCNVSLYAFELTLTAWVIFVF